MDTSLGSLRCRFHCDVFNLDSTPYPLTPCSTSLSPSPPLPLPLSPPSLPLSPSLLSLPSPPSLPPPSFLPPLPPLLPPQVLLEAEMDKLENNQKASYLKELCGLNVDNTRYLVAKRPIFQAEKEVVVSPAPNINVSAPPPPGSSNI